MMTMTGEKEQQQFGEMSWSSAVGTHSLVQSRSTDDYNDYNDYNDYHDLIMMMMMTATVMMMITIHGGHAFLGAIKVN